MNRIQSSLDSYESQTKCDDGQTFQLPIELDAHILSFVLAELEDPCAELTPAHDALLAYSLTCHRFRSLALPHLFQHFCTARSPDSKMSQFCKAWVNGDESAKKCASYIQDCVHSYGRRSPFDARIAQEYTSSFALLPNLSSLSIFSTPIDPSLLDRILTDTPVKQLRFRGRISPPPNQLDIYNFIDDLCSVLRSHSKSLTSLEFNLSHFMIDLRMFSGVGFQLDSFSIFTFGRTELVSHRYRLQSFLKGMPSLTTLEFNDGMGGLYHFSDMQFSPNDLPNLHTLACPIYCVPNLVPGSRHIKSLRLEHSLDGMQYTTLEIAAFVDALRYSSHSIRYLSGIPLPVAVGAWGSYTPKIEYVGVVIPADFRMIYDDSKPPRMHEDIVNIIENLGGRQPLTWPNFSTLEVSPEEPRPGESFGPPGLEVDIEAYTLQLALQKEDVTKLEKRFASVMTASLGLYTCWQRPPGVTAGEDGWKLKVIESVRHSFEAIAKDHTKAYKKEWKEWDWGGVLAGILERNT